MRVDTEEKDGEMKLKWVGLSMGVQDGQSDKYAANFRIYEKDEIVEHRVGPQVNCPSHSGWQASASYFSVERFQY